MSQIVMSPAALIALTLLAAGPAGVEDLRTQRLQAEQRQASVEAQLGEQQTTLETVSKRIDDLKSRRQSSASPFVPGGLEDLLKQSQALSQTLAELRAQAASARTDDEAARSELARAIDSRLATDRAALSTPSPSANLVSEIHTLETERASLATPMGVANTNPAAVHFNGRTDDPRELRERADALRDRADKLAKEQARVVARIQELRDQAELDRQLSSTSRQDALFDESDAKVVVQRQIPSATPATPAISASGGAKDTAAPRRTWPLYSGDPLHVPPPSIATGQTDALNPGGTLQNGPVPNGRNDQSVSTPVTITPLEQPVGVQSPTQPVQTSSLTTSVVQGQVVRPDELGKENPALAPLDESSVDDLQAAKARLEQELSQLRQQAAALDRQAAQAK